MENKGFGWPSMKYLEGGLQDCSVSESAGLDGPMGLL